MHPLLIPSSHAEADLAARHLSDSGLFGTGTPALFYARIMFGATLNLTITESINGITFDEGRLVVKQPLLIERVIKRSPGYEVKVITATEEVCDLNLFRDGKICGQVILKGSDVKPPVDKMGLYYLTLAKAARLYYTDLFGHKFFLRTELSSTSVSTSSAQEKVSAIMEQAGESLPLQTASLLTTPRVTYNKKEQAENAKALLEWQNQIDQLSPENPGEWDEHAQALNKLSFLPPGEVKGLWKKYKLAAERVGVGYDSASTKFFLIEWQTHEE
jgi:hypothetical protein